MVQLATIVDEGKTVEVKTVLQQKDISEEWCREVFDKFDANKSGEIDIRELQGMTLALGLSMDRESINNSMFELDQNRNGAISFQEFWDWWQTAAIRKAGTGSGYTTGGAQQSPQRGGSRAASRGGAQPRRPKSEQSSRSLGGSSLSFSRPGSRGSNLDHLKEMLLGAKGLSGENYEDKAPGYLASKSPGSGMWLTQQGGRPGSRTGSALSRPSRPVTRNSQRSVAGQDYSPPPLLNRPPRLHGIRALRASLPPRPQTAPVDPMGQMMSGEMGPPASGYIRYPGTPAVPQGVTTGYVL